MTLKIINFMYVNHSEARAAILDFTSV